MKVTNMKTKKEITIEDLKNPILIKNAIDTVLDPKNPDSNKLRKEIIKSINSEIKKDTAFLTTVKGQIVENGENITREFVEACMDEYKEQLTNALTTTINIQCQEFFNERKEIINKILKKTLDECVQDILNAAKEVTEKHAKKIKTEQAKNVCNLEIPMQHRDEMINYLNYLNNKRN